MPHKEPRKTWSRKQWLIRRAVLDRLNLWQSTGYQCVWLTLTSAPGSSAELLRKHFQVLRKRIDRQLGYPGVQYVCVDTREGHGVLHMILAWRQAMKGRSFYIPFDWLQENWKDIHGAFHVNIKRIGGDSKDARRLSRYIVSQYCGDQDGLVRLSQSKPDVPLSRMREALRRAFRTMPERYEYGASLGPLSPEEFKATFASGTWKQFRTAWDALVRTRSCELFGVRFVWFGDRLERV